MKEKIKKLWNFFTPYEKIWTFSIIGLSLLITFLFPSTVDDLGINPALIMGLYLLDILFNVICELLIAKQIKWNCLIWGAMSSGNASVGGGLWRIWQKFAEYPKRCFRRWNQAK